MTIVSLDFLAFLLGAVACFHLPPRGWRPGLLFPATCLVFLVLVSHSAAGIAALLGFFAVFWLLLEFAIRNSGRHALVGVLAVVLLGFGWLKGYDVLRFLPLSSAMPDTIGLSYILIRSIQLVFDSMETPPSRLNPVTVFSFLMAWPCLVSGPIQRYQDFERQLAGMTTFCLGRDVVLRAMERIIRGYFFVCVMGDATRGLWLGLKEIAFDGPHPLALGVSQAAFLFHLFFDFAGYTEIVIGAGSLFGLTLPENFNRPFLAHSFLEFWNRWHMTMSGFFKTYVFNPTALALARIAPSPAWTVVCATVAFFATFFLVGLWHGTTWAFVICGLMLGLGASVNHAYTTRLRAVLGRSRHERLTSRLLYIAPATTFAFTYLCLSVTPLWMTADELSAVLGRYGPAGLVLAEGVLFLVLLMTIPWWSKQGDAKRRPLWLRCVLMGAQLAAIQLYGFLFPATGGLFFYEQF